MKGDEKMAPDEARDSVDDERRAWHKPKLSKLGSLGDFVQTGNAFGKSGDPSDGGSMPGGERMVRT